MQKEKNVFYMRVSSQYSEVNT